MEYVKGYSWFKIVFDKFMCVDVYRGLIYINGENKIKISILHLERRIKEYTGSYPCLQMVINCGVCECVILGLGIGNGKQVEIHYVVSLEEKPGVL